MFRNLYMMYYNYRNRIYLSVLAVRNMNKICAFEDYMLTIYFVMILKDSIFSIHTFNLINKHIISDEENKISLKYTFLINKNFNVINNYLHSELTIRCFIIRYENIEI